MLEGELADALGKIHAEFPTVNIGSYLNTQASMAAYNVYLALDSRDPHALAEAVQMVERDIHGIAGPAAE